MARLIASFLSDLRFFIGLFFLLVGAIISLEGLFNPVMVEGVNLDLITGICFLVFACFALALSIHGHYRPKKNN